MKVCIKLFFILQIFLINLYSLPQVVITEVAPDQQRYKDWIELFVSSTISLTELKNLSLEITHYNLTKTCSFQNVITSTSGVVEKGKFVIIYINAESDKVEFDTKNNLVIQLSTTTFYITQYGMYSSDVIVAIKSQTTYIDAVCFTDKDGSPESTIINKLGELISNSQWKAEGWDGTYSQKWCASSDGLDNNITLQRLQDGSGLPLDTNSKDDWIIKPQTLGYGYKEVVSETQKVVEVDKTTNPFCPEDLNNNFVKINFFIDDFDAKKTIVIYDITGNEIVKLLDRDRLPNGDVSTYSSVRSGSITWDGRKSDGSRVKTGVYIVYFEAYNSTNGKKYVGKDVIAVGRKW